uniref:Uncharacterized protein n=1 Tax=Eptatretus burgeri TaxID=7764 RepID=A0A8C4NKW7_EPTBU
MGDTSSSGVRCAGCGIAICDRFLLRMGQEHWHETCLACTACHAPLRRTCYRRNHRPYCKQDYLRLFGARCPACGEPIPPLELVLRARGLAFHLPCFRCAVCQRPLRTGDLFVLRNGRPVCRPPCRRHCELPSPPSPSPHHPASSMAVQRSGIVPEIDRSTQESEDDGSGEQMITGSRRRKGCGPEERREGKRPKRPRTILTPQQRRAFKASFELSAKPSRKVREMLAAETGLNVRVVQVWFQNQRAKMKKLARRQNQAAPDRPALRTGPGRSHSKSSKRPKSEADAARKACSCSAVDGRGGTDDGARAGTQAGSNPAESCKSFVTEAFSEGLTPPQLPGDHLLPYGQDSCIVGPATVSRLQTRAGNPIDHLYSMQTSYFNS